MHKKYHLSENPIPDGYRIYLNYLPIMGLHRRKRDAAKFCKASKRELSLEREPDNPHDGNALKIVGSWKGWFGRKSRQLGYVPAEHAAKLVMLGLAEKVAARIAKTYVGKDGYVEIEYQIIGPKAHYETFAPTPPTIPATAASANAALTKLDALIVFLNEAPRMSRQEVERLYKASFTETFDTMVEQGKSYGEASGGPDFLDQPESKFRTHLHSIDNDLGAQTDIVDIACRKYFETGDIPAPYYPWRIAIILSKLKHKDREHDFLAAWCRHFPKGNGVRYADLVKRAEKLGIKVSS